MCFYSALITVTLISTLTLIITIVIIIMIIIKVKYSFWPSHDWKWSVSFLPARRYASAGLCDSDVSVCLSVRLSHAGIVPSRAKAGS